MSNSHLAQQYAFAATIRDPENQAKPAHIEARRMRIYQELFFNNIKSFVSSAFPVLCSLVDEEVWDELVRLFMVKHRCQSPYFLQISEEFLAFLNSGVELPINFDFMLELAHYEWVELALFVSNEDDEIDEGISTDWLNGVPRSSNLAWHLAYRYDVHRIGPEYIPNTAPPQPSYLIVYRNAEEDIKFMEINAVTFRMLQIIDEQDQLSGKEILSQIAEELQHPNASAVLEGGVKTMEQLYERGILLGVTRR